jgi:hypothetical protein
MVPPPVSGGVTISDVARWNLDGMLKFTKCRNSAHGVMGDRSR